MGDDSALRQRLADLAATVKNQEYILSRAVHEAQEAGATWQDIGGVLGLSAEAAEARFGTNKGEETP